MNVPAINAVLPSPGSPDFAASVQRLPPARQRQVVAQAFEAIILRELLAPVMNKMAGAGSGDGVYGFMMTDAFAQKLSTGGGIGLAAMLEKQFTPPAAASAARHPSTDVTSSKSSS